MKHSLGEVARVVLILLMICGRTCQLTKYWFGHHDEHVTYVLCALLGLLVGACWVHSIVDLASRKLLGNTGVNRPEARRLALHLPSATSVDDGVRRARAGTFLDHVDDRRRAHRQREQRNHREKAGGVHDEE